MVSTIPFKTPDKTFSFIPKKLAILIILGLLVSMYYSIFIVSFTYVILNLISYFNKRFLGNGIEETEIEEFVEVVVDENEEKGE